MKFTGYIQRPISIRPSWLPNYANPQMCKTNPNRLVSLPLRCIAIFFATFAPFSANALSYFIDLDAGFRADSNANPSFEARASDQRYSAGLNLTARENNRRLAFNTDYQLDRRWYDRGTNPDRNFLDGNSIVRFQILPKRLQWVGYHSSIERRNFLRDIDTPENSVRRQSYSTGPVLSMRVGKHTEASISGLLGEVRFSNQTLPENNNAGVKNTSTNFSLAHSLSSVSTIRGGYSYFSSERLSIESTFETAFIGFERNLRFLTYALRIGSSRNQTETLPSDTSINYNASIEHKSIANQFTLRSSRQQTNALNSTSDFGSSLSLSLSQNVIAAIENSDTTFELGDFDEEGTTDLTLINLSWNSSIMCARCKHLIGFGHVQRESSNNSALDNSGFRYRANLSYKLTRTIDLSIRSLHRTLSTNDDNINQKVTVSSLMLNFSPNRNLDIELSGGYRNRDSDDDTSFSNAFGGLRISYSLLARE